MDYLSLSLQISPTEPFADLLSYRLGEAGFDMFEEQPGGIIAYIPSGQFNSDEVRSILDECREMGCTIASELKEIPWQNWNETWEKNFRPEVISNRVYIRASFHPPDSRYPIELIIEPRMAFGTGHHATTRQMLEQMLLLDWNHKTVLDMGCGTGILALLAAKLGAASVTAIDNDPNSVSITGENAVQNNCTVIHPVLGEGEDIKGEFDRILANINRNIILRDLPLYQKAMRAGAHLLTSGYYLNDLEAIVKACEKQGLKYMQHSEQENWCCALFIQP